MSGNRARAARFRAARFGAANREAGLSLLELVVFIVVVGTGLAGVLSVLNLTASKSSDPFYVKQSLAAAEAVLEEVLLKNYSNPTGGFTGPYTQANRQYFDDVDDFITFSTSGIYTVTGSSPLPGLGSYNLTRVDVVMTTLNGAPAKLVTVTVADPTGATYSLAGYRTSY